MIILYYYIIPVICRHLSIIIERLFLIRILEIYTVKPVKMFFKGPV